MLKTAAKIAGCSRRAWVDEVLKQQNRLTLTLKPKFETDIPSAQIHSRRESEPLTGDRPLGGPRLVNVAGRGVGFKIPLTELTGFDLKHLGMRSPLAM
jgi:hypothetical protein